MKIVDNSTEKSHFSFNFDLRTWSPGISKNCMSDLFKLNRIYCYTEANFVNTMQKNKISINIKNIIKVSNKVSIKM